MLDPKMGKKLPSTFVISRHLLMGRYDMIKEWRWKFQLLRDLYREKAKEIGFALIAPN